MNSANYIHIEHSSENKTVSSANKANKENNKKVVIASAIGSTIGIAGAVAGIYALKKKVNPSLKLTNLNYEEKDILMLGAGSVLGGLTGGLITDNNKKNTVPKLREASMQFFGSLACPLAILTAANKIFDKTGFKMPEIKGNSSAIKAANTTISALPKISITFGSLIAGMNIGNKIMNKVNNKIFDKEEHRNIHTSDYLVHADDICIASSLLFKDSQKISAITSKILPASFILAGAKSGMQTSEN